MKIETSERDTLEFWEDALIEHCDTHDFLNDGIRTIFKMGIPRYKAALDLQLMAQGLNPNSLYVTLTSGLETVTDDGSEYRIARRFSPADAGDEFKLQGVRPCGDPASTHSWNILALVDSQPPTQFPAFFGELVQRFSPGRTIEVTHYEEA